MPLYTSNKYTKATEQFEKEMMLMFNDLPEREQKKIDKALGDLVEQLKTGHTHVQMSKQGLLTAIMAALYTMRFGESPAATAIRTQYTKGGMSDKDTETLVEARF